MDFYTVSAKLELYEGPTSAGDTHILIVVTVVNAPAQTSALAEVCFISSAVHVVQRYEPHPMFKSGHAVHLHGHPAVPAVYTPR